MDSHRQPGLGAFAVVYVRDGKGSTPLRDPILRVIEGHAFLQGTYAWHGEHWLNGSVTLIPLGEVTGIFSFSSDQEYASALERHRTRQEEKSQAKGTTKAPTDHSTDRDT